MFVIDGNVRLTFIDHEALNNAYKLNNTSSLTQDFWWQSPGGPVKSFVKFTGKHM